MKINLTINKDEFKKQLDVKDGVPGKDGIAGKDGLNGNDGLRGEKGEQGVPGKDGSSDTPEEIRDKLESLEGDERLDISAIKGLDEKFKRFEKSSKTAYSSGKTKIIVKDLSPQLNGVLKTFTIGTHFGIIGVFGSSAPFPFRPTIDYTEVGKTIVFDTNIDASISLAQGQTLIVQYLK